MDVVRRLRDVVAAAGYPPAGRSLPPGRIVCACSGGPDSTALTDAIAHVLAAAGSAPPLVAAVDHGLRPAAAAEAEAVVAWARARGQSATVLRVSVAGKSMAAARHARYDALVNHARAVGASVIAVAHTATDQAETLLDRLIRGAGTRGLSGMAPLRRVDGGVWLWRPLLTVDRATVEAYIDALQLPVVRDPTNDDCRYRRSRIRHEVLPLLRRERPDLDVALAELCDRLRADADSLDAAAAQAHARLQAPDGSLDAAALAALDDALFARVVARASGLMLQAVHIHALRRLCADRRGTRSLDLPARTLAERRYDRLTFATPGKKSAPIDTAEVAVDQPGIYLLDGMEVEVSADLYQALGGGPLRLRHVRPGDRARTGKLSDLLVNAKVPRPDRARLPILARPDGEVVWISGLPWGVGRLSFKSAVQ
jgi:tRNA(Ile)-lysidine synthetase-like protein